MSFSLKAQFISLALVLLTAPACLAGKTHQDRKQAEAQPAAQTTTSKTILTPRQKDFYADLLKAEAFITSVSAAAYQDDSRTFFYLSQTETDACQKKMQRMHALRKEAARQLSPSDPRRQDIEFVENLLWENEVTGLCARNRAVEDSVYEANSETLDAFVDARENLLGYILYAEDNGGLSTGQRKACQEQARLYLANGKALLQKGFPPIEGDITLGNIGQMIPADFCPAAPSYRAATSSTLKRVAQTTKKAPKGP